MGFYQRHLFPRVLDLAMRRSALAEQREWLLKQVRGQVLEVGFGTGLNLPYYPREVRALTVVEPDAALRARAEKRIAKSGKTVSVVAGRMDRKLPLADASFDTVVSTWTLCTIPDPGAALKEVYRLLKRGGQFLYVEHGLAPDSEVVKWQKRFNGLTNKWGGGCNLDRDIEEIIRRSKLEVEKLEKFYLDKGLRAGAYTYRGVAVREQKSELRIRTTPLK